MVWIHATPEKDQFTRLENFQFEGKQVIYPEITNNYLVKILYEDLGACTVTGNGLAPLSWQEIESWQRQVGIELTPFEINTLKKASEAYVSQTVFSRDPKCLPPVKEVIVDVADDKVEKIKSLLRSKNGD